MTRRFQAWGNRKLQRSLYYNRRRRESLRSVPKLFRTQSVAIGATVPDVFPATALQSPVTFRLKTQASLLAASDQLLSLGPSGSSLRIVNTPPNMEVYWQDTLVMTVERPEDAVWDMVLTLVPGAGAARLWNQYGQIGDFAAAEDDLPTFASFASADDDMTADSDLLSPISVYALQFPQHYTPLAGQVTADENDENQILLNLTAAKFISGFPWPLFEPSS